MRTLRLSHLAAALAAALLALGPASPRPTDACVGRKLVLGALEGPRQGMVSRLLSTLIHERTGTTVESRFFASEEEMLAEVRAGRVDLYVDAVDRALVRSGRPSEQADADARFLVVKRIFDEEQNLVWLKPMGFRARDARGMDLGPASVVARKDALKKFPALPRLLEKLGSQAPLDDATLDALVGRGTGQNPAKVAREYLREVKLI